MACKSQAIHLPFVFFFTLQMLLGQVLQGVRKRSPVSSSRLLRFSLHRARSKAAPWDEIIPLEEACGILVFLRQGL
eukprot:880522-Rhodomonas_salina.1